MMSENPATATRAIDVRNRYLHLPVRNGAHLRKLAVTVGGSRQLSCGEKSSLEPLDGGIRLQVFVDRTAIDIIADDGRLYMPMGVDLSGGDPSLSLRAEGG